jgi:hypothetical protein
MIELGGADHRHAERKMSRIGIFSAVLITGALAMPVAAAGQQTSGIAMSAGALLVPAPTESLLPASAWAGEARIGEPRAPLLELPQVRNRRGIPFMIAGGAMFLAGAIIGDDGGTILILGGIGVGAYGAYVYFGNN